MASPQKENGYTQIATEIVETMCRTHLSGYETRVLWVVLRKTFGWKKKSDWISLSQFVVSTGIKRPHVCRALRMLVKQNIITKGGTRTQPKYSFQKDYDRWKPLPKGARSHHVTKGGNSVLPKGVIRGVPKGAHTKDTITKDTITKETSVYTDESFLSFWDAYPRKETKKPSYDLWKRKKLSNHLKELLEFIEKAKKTDRWVGGYIPLPTTFLKQERWNDDLSAYESKFNKSKTINLNDYE